VCIVVVVWVLVVVVTRSMVGDIVVCLVSLAWWRVKVLLCFDRVTVLCRACGYCCCSAGVIVEPLAVSCCVGCVVVFVR
jgi:hypothetical protein